MSKLPCIFLYSVTAAIAEPWAEAGHACLIVDYQHPPGVRQIGHNLWAMGADLMYGFIPPRGFDGPLAFIGCFSPCDHTAVSGARWFVHKGVRALAWSLHVWATAQEFMDKHPEASSFNENPVSHIASYAGPAKYSFSPWQFTQLHPADNYNKATCLWTNDSFVMPEPCPLPEIQEAVAFVNGDKKSVMTRANALQKFPDSELVRLWYPDDRIHLAPPRRRKAQLPQRHPCWLRKGSEAR